METMNLNLSNQKSSEIRKMFSRVARRYDLANDLLSMGIHRLWRKNLVDNSEVQIGEKVLDCATGTGDLAIEFKKAVGNSGQVIGIDFCKEMLDFAPQKAFDKGLDVHFRLADVKDLPFEDGTFDHVSIAFGIRNVDDPHAAMCEMIRVLKPGGRIHILEFGQPKVPVFSNVYRFFSEKVIPQLGGIATGQKEAYNYLQTSSAQFPCGENFITWMNKVELLRLPIFRPLSGGICYLYSARKAETIVNKAESNAPKADT